MSTFMDILSCLPSWLTPVVLAPFAGSFLGVLIQRIPQGRPFVLARSSCEHCGHVLAARDMVPIVSYGLLLGRCRYCGASIGHVPIVAELAALAVAIWAAIAGGWIWTACLLGWPLLALAWIDLRSMLLPDVLTLPLLMLGLVVTGVASHGELLDRALAVAAGYFSLFSISWFYRRYRGRDGLGLGDAKLLAAIGAWLGLALLPAVLLLASGLGLLAVGGSILAGRRITAATEIPFGPFLAFAAWILWLYGASFENWLMG